MQILLGVIIGALVGIAVHYLVPDRPTRGVALGPLLGAISAGIAWTILTWAGIGIDSLWPWLAAILVPSAVTWPALLILSRSRVHRDARERAALKIG